MKRFYKAVTCKLLLVFMLIQPALACAAPLNFDCDVPPNRYSSISEEPSGEMIISGTVESVEMRSGKTLPVAGAKLISVDKKSAAGFQLVADSAHAKQFDIILNINFNDDLRQKKVGQVSAAGFINFSLSLSATGIITLLINEMQFDVDFIAMPLGKKAVFCSTGQFKFSNLTFVFSKESTGSTAH